MTAENNGFESRNVSDLQLNDPGQDFITDRQKDSKLPFDF